jgi:hypothetical protein
MTIQEISGLVRRITEAKVQSKLDTIVYEIMRMPHEDRELVLGALAACGQQSQKLGQAPSREVGTSSGNRFYVHSKFRW